MPSKTLRSAILDMTGFVQSVYFGGGHRTSHEISVDDLKARLIKLIFHAETLDVLAVHIIGTGATELIPLGQMAIALRVRVDYFVDNIFNYPTFAEGFRIAALDGMNKVRGSDAAALLGGPN